VFCCVGEVLREGSRRANPFKLFEGKRQLHSSSSSSTYPDTPAPEKKAKNLQKKI